VLNCGEISFHGIVGCDSDDIVIQNVPVGTLGLTLDFSELFIKTSTTWAFYMPIPLDPYLFYDDNNCLIWNAHFTNPSTIYEKIFGSYLIDKQTGSFYKVSSNVSSNVCGTVSNCWDLCYNSSVNNGNISGNINNGNVVNIYSNLELNCDQDIKNVKDLSVCGNATFGGSISGNLNNFNSNVIVHSNIDMTKNIISNIAPPQNPCDVVNKEYVDNKILDNKYFFTANVLEKTFSDATNVVEDIYVISNAGNYKFEWTTELDIGNSHVYIQPYINGTLINNSFLPSAGAAFRKTPYTGFTVLYLPSGNISANILITPDGTIISATNSRLFLSYLSI
jgi:hypothetical protein